MTTFVEIMRGLFAWRVEASLVVTTARSLGFEVEVRDAGAGRVLVVVEGLRANGGAACAMRS